MNFLINGEFVETSVCGSFAPSFNYAPQSVPVPSASLGVVMADCVRSKVAAQRRACYVKSLTYYLGRFTRGRETLPISVVRTEDVESWLAKFTDASSRQTWLNRVNTLFSYATKREIIARNPCDKIERVVIDHKTPDVLTVEQADQLLRHVVKYKHSQLATLVLGLFAGLRPGEVGRITWDAVNLDAAQIAISAAASKVRRRRVVTLQPNAVAWLRLAKELNALLPPSEQSTRRFRRQWAKVLGFKGGWPADILRHTAATHMLAATGDAGKVATQLGNSIAVLHRHYFGVTQPDEAKIFWSIMP